MRFLNASVLERKSLNRSLSWGFPVGNLLLKTRVLERCVSERKREPNANASVLGLLRFRTLRTGIRSTQPHPLWPKFRKRKRHIRQITKNSLRTPLDGGVSLKTPSRRPAKMTISSGFSIVKNRQALAHRPVALCLSRRVSQGHPASVPRFSLSLCASFFPESDSPICPNRPSRARNITASKTSMGNKFTMAIPKGYRDGMEINA